MKIHAFVKIVLYLSALLISNFLSTKAMIVFFVSSILLAIALNGSLFIKRFMKLRWLIISIILVYGLTVPGQYLISYQPFYVLTKEGFLFGLIQAVKLVFAIAMLDILFYKTSIDQLVNGLYLLLKPLSMMKFNVEQFVVRLMLTLNYVDKITISSVHKSSFLYLHEMLNSPSNSVESQSVVIDAHALSLFDYLALLLAAIVFLILLFVEL